MEDRSDYRLGTLEIADLSPSPFQQLEAWISIAKQAEGVIEPTAMCIGTSTPEGRPSARYVLLRGLDERGLVFFTNYESRKGREIADNPFACATFWWGALQRQVRVEGWIEKTSPEESDSYFHSRPRDSQIASAASPQSQVVEDRHVLEALAEQVALEQRESIERPTHWGGYRLVPDRFEFWQGRRARLHDRLAYRQEGQRWMIERLAP